MPTLGNERELLSEIWKLIRSKNGSDIDSAFQKINNNRQTFSNKIREVFQKQIKKFLSFLEIEERGENHNVILDKQNEIFN